MRAAAEVGPDDLAQVGHHPAAVLVDGPGAEGGRVPPLLAPPAALVVEALAVDARVKSGVREAVVRAAGEGEVDAVELRAAGLDDGLADVGRPLVVVAVLRGEGGGVREGVRGVG